MTRHDDSVRLPRPRTARFKLSCAPLVAMMETADFGDRDDEPDRWSGDQPVIWCVFLKPKVRSAPMIVPAVGREDAPEMRLVDDDHVIETLSSDRADQAFDIRILAMDSPARRRLRRCPCQPVGAGRRRRRRVSISVQPTRRRIVWKGVDHLLSGPAGRRMLCNLTSTMRRR